IEVSKDRHASSRVEKNIRERGSNECANKLIRHSIPKGADIAKYSKKIIRYIEHRINNYPRKMFGGFSSFQLANAVGVNF
ncbi:MAG: hypothetical protein IJ251_02975, partial [Oscillospiraceae bacterium]|nr:hypothetical protein [Oscillospiraceae bacterium]